MSNAPPSISDSASSNSPQRSSPAAAASSSASSFLQAEQESFSPDSSVRKSSLFTLEDINSPPHLNQILRGIITDDPEGLLNSAAQFFAVDGKDAIPRHRWKPHIPKLAHLLDIDALKSLSGTEESAATLEYCTKYLNDASIYSDMPQIRIKDVRKSSTLAKFTQTLIDANIFEPVTDPSTVRGTAHLFFHPEPHKNRLRIVVDASDQNVYFTDHHVPPRVTFSTLDDLKQFVHSGNFAITSDFKWYYGQFPCSDEVRNYYCVKLPVYHQGKLHWKLFRHTRGVTGLGPMVATAVASTKHLLAFPRHCQTIDWIDNIALAGDTAEHVVEDTFTLFKRCAAAHVTVNDIDVQSVSREDIKKLVVTDFDFCGMRHDLAAKTVRLTEKIVKKIAFTWQHRHQWSWSGFASMLALLRYAASVIDIPVAHFFKLQRFASRVSLHMYETEDKIWNSPAVIPDAIMFDLSAWAAICMVNKPYPVPRRVDQPDFFVTVDASKTGWGYAALHVASGKSLCHRASWSPSLIKRFGEHKLRESVFTESHAILNMKTHLLEHLPVSFSSSSPSSPSSAASSSQAATSASATAAAAATSYSFQIASDSVTAVALFRRGWMSRSFALNEVALHDRANLAFKQHHWRYLHIPGKRNIIADRLSRAVNENCNSANWEMESAVAEELTRFMGETALGGTKAVVGATRPEATTYNAS